MDGDDIAADKDWGGSGGKSSDSFIDRSKVRILMCDNDAKSSKEAFTLLCKCSYQVTSVRSARQVIDALNAEGPDIDIILSEVDLPMAKGLKMLKYIMRDKELRRIPVIMMSAQDEVSIVVKCLRLGAADYLVKPLRTNELLNLWTHMWRRRQMLGLLEKKIMNFDFDLVASDPSDANTNSTTLFSDDTDDKSKKNANPELCMSTHQEEEVNVVERQIMEEHSGFTGLQRSGKNTQSNSGITAAPVDPPPVVSLDYGPEVLGTSNRQTGQFSSCPKKSELRIGGSSAFFSYVKHSMPKSNTQVVVPAAETASLELRIKQRLETWSGQTCRDTINLEKHMGNGAQNHEKREVKENHSPGDDFPSSCSIRDSLSMDRSSTPPVLTESTHCSNSTKEDFSQAHVHLRNVSHHDVRAIHAHTAYPYYISGMMNQIMMPSSQMYQKNLQDLPAHAASTLLPQFGHVPQVPHVPGMASYPYYPVGICMQPGQMPGASPWPLYGSSTTAEEKLGKVGRREAALIKFRQKRKERCFDKKIRYVNRKRLAERRPRVRGQFVRKINGINVDLNGQPASLDYDVEEEEDEYEEDSGARDSFPEDEEDNAATDPSTFQS